MKLRNKILSCLLAVSLAAGMAVPIFALSPRAAAAKATGTITFGTPNAAVAEVVAVSGTASVTNSDSILEDTNITVTDTKGELTVETITLTAADTGTTWTVGTDWTIANATIKKTGTDIALAFTKATTPADGTATITTTAGTPATLAVAATTFSVGGVVFTYVSTTGDGTTTFNDVASLIACINANTTTKDLVVATADGETGVKLTAKTAGVAGNDIALAVANAGTGCAVSATTLADGTDEVVDPISIAAAAVTLDKTTAVYTGGPITASVVSVKLGNDTLVLTTDYTVAIADNTSVGNATVTVTGNGKYTGTATKAFAITQFDLATCGVAITHNDVDNDGTINVSDTLKAVVSGAPTGATFTYQWKNGTDTATGGGNSSDTYTVAAIGTDAADAVLSCIIANSDATNIKGSITPPTATVGAAKVSITSVAVAPATVSVAKGTTKQFTSTVVGTGAFSNDVVWTVSGGANAATQISNTGVLTIAATETATSLTVKATSVADNTKSGTAAVTVTTPSVTPTPPYTPPSNNNSYSGSSSNNTAAPTEGSGLTITGVPAEVSANTPAGTAAAVEAGVTNITNPSLDAKPIPVNSAAAQEFVKAATGFAITQVLDINMFDSTVRVTKVEGGKVQIALPFNAPDASKEYVVLRLNDDKSVSVIPATLSNGKIVFKTDHFSRYAIAVKSDNANLFGAVSPTTNTGTSEVPKTGVSILAPLF